MRDSCTRNDQQTRCSDWGKKKKKKGSCEISVASPVSVFLHSLSSAWFSCDSLSNKAGDETRSPVHRSSCILWWEAPGDCFIRRRGQSRLLFPTGIYNLQAQLHSKWGPKTTAIRLQRHETRTSAVFGWGVKGRDRIRVNDFEAGWLWPAMAPDSVRGSRQREVLCLIWPSFSASSTMTDVFKWLFLWQMLNANYS